MGVTDNLAEARQALDSLKAQMAGAGMGNFVLPQFVGSYQLVLDYARLRMLLAALETDADPAVTAALAAPPATPSPTVPAGPPAQQNGSGLIVPSVGG